MTRPGRATLRRCAALCSAVLAAAAGGPALGQGEDTRVAPVEAPSSVDIPQLSAAVGRAIAAPYLTEDEARALRVFHGVWTRADLEHSAALKARAALIAGAFDSAVFEDASVDPLDRAEAKLALGDLDGAIALAGAPAAVGGGDAVRAARIMAEALEQKGAYEPADAAVQPVVDALASRGATAAELTDGVRALQVRARFRGLSAAEYERMIGLLARAYQEVDALHWPAVLVEAEVLAEKDNGAQARDAAVQALSMCPNSAEATALFGQMAVAGFDFVTASEVAARLDDLSAQVGGGRPSLGGAMIRARGWIRQAQPDEADAALDALGGRYATSPALLALRAAVAALRYDDALVERKMAEFAAAAPGSAQAEYEIGRALSEARQYELAAGYLHSAHLKRPKWAQPLIDLGLLEMQAGRDMLARPYLRTANGLDPFNVRVRNSLKLIETVSEWPVAESEHFRVRHPGAEFAVMAREMLPELEEMHADLRDLFGHEPAVKTLIELLPDNEWFGVRITGMPELFTIAAATGPVVAMEAPRDSPRAKVGVYDWVRVVRHEYAHTVTLSRTNNRLSHWFTEAAAVYSEDAPRDYTRCTLLAAALADDELFTLDEINLKFVRPEKPTDRSQAYAQGHWMYEFMVERFGAEAPLRLMDRYAEGDREQAAFTSALGVSPGAFFDQFVEWARGQVIEWGFDPEPSIAALQLEETLLDVELRREAAGALGRFARHACQASAGTGEASEYGVSLVPVSEDLLAYWSVVYPDHPDILHEVVRMALEQRGGAADESLVPLLERYADARPVDPMPHQALARMYLQSSEPSRAVPHLKYLDVRETYRPIYAVELARRLAAEKDFAGALGYANRATQIAPFDADYRELAATIAIQANRLDEAERHIGALVEIEPERGVHAKRLEAVRQMQEERE